MEIMKDLLILKRHFVETILCVCRHGFHQHATSGRVKLRDVRSIQGEEVEFFLTMA